MFGLLQQHLNLYPSCKQGPGTILHTRATACPICVLWSLLVYVNLPLIGKPTWCSLGSSAFSWSFYLLLPVSSLQPRGQPCSAPRSASGRWSVQSQGILLTGSASPWSHQWPASLDQWSGPLEEEKTRLKMEKGEVSSESCLIPWVRQNQPNESIKRGQSGKWAITTYLLAPGHRWPALTYVIWLNPHNHHRKQTFYTI